MRGILALPLALLFAVLSVGCSDNLSGEVPMVGVSDHSLRVAGNWEATTFEFVSDAQPAVRRDLIAEGWRYSTVIERNGQFFRMLVNPEGVVRTQTGAVQMNGTQLVFFPTGQPGAPAEVFEAELVSGALTLNGPGRLDFGNGMAEPGMLRLRMVGR
jgi:hypothetical protein